jgi:hypothetical protein
MLGPYDGIKSEERYTTKGIGAVDDEPHRYLSYLLRVWRVGRQRSGIWRASLESPRSGERLSFPDLEALFAYLRGLTSTPPSADRDRDVPVDRH